MGVFLVPVEKGRPIALDKAVVFIGRHPDCDVVLTRSKKVSRKHCCVATVNDRFVVRDLGSLNGVRINGRRVKIEASVQLGDEVAIGDVCYILRIEESSPDGRGNGDAKPDVARPDESSKPADNEPVAPVNLSREFPVAIPDNGESFAVESSIRETPNAIPLAESAAPVDDEGEDVMLIEDNGDPDNGDPEIELTPE